MKNHLVTAECILFTLILTFFVLPPLFVSPAAQSAVPAAAPLTVAVHALLGFFLYVFATIRTVRTERGPSASQNFCRTALSAVLALLLVGLSSFLLRLAQFRLEPTAAPLPVLPPEKTKLILLIFATAVFAFYEEILYRLYLPLSLARLAASSGRYQSSLSVLVEIIPVVLFALAHRYLGFFAVVNALLAAIVFRLLVKKTGAVWSACIVHYAYNLIALFIR